MSEATETKTVGKAHSSAPCGQVHGMVVPFDLQPFCADFDTIYDLRRPFSEGEYTIATDGILLVRVPRRQDVPSRDDGFQALDSQGKHMAAEPEQWFPLPAVETKQVVCRDCGGAGQIFTCPECEGEGSVAFANDWNEYEIDCDTCDGDGFLKKEKWLDATKGTGKSATCEDCQGTGKVVQEKGIKIGCAWFTDSFLARLAKLPGKVEIGPVSAIHPARFRFDGGDGLIMVRYED